MAEHIVRHANGNYYPRSKVLGKGIRVSLNTKDPRKAKIMRDRVSPGSGFFVARREF